MNKPLAAIAAVCASFALGPAFAQSDAMSNEIAAGAAAPLTSSSVTRDEVTRPLQKAAVSDGMATESGAGAAAPQSTPSMTTREKIRAALTRAQHQPHSQMDTERAAWG